MHNASLSSPLDSVCYAHALIIVNLTNKGNTLGKKIKMNYASYATSIQLKHHIELIGWPVNIPFQNPSAIGVVADTHKLHDSLLLGVCIWKVMNPAC